VALLLYLGYSSSLLAQTENPVNSTIEQQIEDITNANDDENTEDDVWLQQLEDYRKNPLNLNTAEADDLNNLRSLTPLQINSFLNYRKVVGKLTSIYELQAVPTWEIETIKKILPFVTVVNNISFTETISTRLMGGEHSVMVRLSQTIEKARGFTDSTSTGNYYPGSPQRLLVRYRYNFKNQLQYGLTAEKDPGEQFFKGAQKSGFDYYSAHFFLRNIGKLRALAFGDYTINIGQGLIQWQSLAYRKGADAMAVRRSSATLRPYNAAGEFNYLRGAAATILIGKNAEATVFGSHRKRDANIGQDTMLFSDPEFASSLLTSGLHRTKSEIADKNALQQTAFGTAFCFRKKNWHFGINNVYYHYNKNLQRANEPYNEFAIAGKHWYNASIDYNYTYKNFHYFGETALSKNGGYAFLDGIMLSLDSKVDMSMVLRNIDKKYQAVYANAFTEGTLPSNESGIYTGISIKPVYGIKIDAYADFYKFPFLRYRVNAPSSGRDYLLQISYKPNKQLDAYIRYRNETKQQNISGLELPTQPVIGLNRKNIRAHIAYKLSPSLQVRQRAEMVWYDRKGPQQSEGFSIYNDLLYKPMLSKFSANMRIQFFDTDDYNSRIYSYENDVLYSFSIPQFNNKGMRYYFNVNYDITQKTSLWLRWSQTVYNQLEVLGSGLDEIEGNKRSDFKVQIRVNF
jgi:hypothetical protein